MEPVEPLVLENDESSEHSHPPPVKALEPATEHASDCKQCDDSRSCEDKAKSTLVDWDGPSDLENPQNFSKARRWGITMITAGMTFCVTFGSSVFSTATEVTAREFNVSSEVMILGVTLYVLGFAVGPLVWGPASELYGRRRPLLLGVFGFIVFQIPVGVATNLETVLICRFFSGAFGSSPLAIASSMYVDMWDPVTRAMATMGFASAVFAGPVTGPIVGEFTVKNPSLGWRWTAWFTMIMGAFFWILALFVTKETLAPVLLQRKAARLRYETKNWALRSQRDEDPVMIKTMMRKYALKPIEMFFQEPILITVTLYMSLVYGLIYLIFFAFPITYQYDRGWDFGISSLPYIAIFVGVVAANAFMAWETRVIFQPKMKKAGRILPEERLPPMMIGSIVLVIGLFWFAWTSFPSINPWPQIVSGAFIGAGIVLVFIPGIIYLVDVYLANASSAIAANTFVRSAVAGAFPLFATYMYTKLGVQWASSLLAFLALALVPAPLCFYLYGKKIRRWSKFAFHPA